ncbi:MAG: YbhB/YbcL family Raf kinase inhibitor-like protein [Salinisphaeraceae bacterium]|nr:YbhB/YbcL family Raf kinase inhibitor-like protein [Salinisphaeraceae bacterium]
MELTSSSFEDNTAIPEEHAFAVIDPSSHVRLSDNRNPALAWRDVPDGTESLVLICHDPDVPSKPDDVNKEDRDVPADLPRVDFYHWVMVDIDPKHKKITDGACSSEITPGGKTNPKGPPGSRQGRNNYTEWFEGDPDMGGTYLGYDGPCPPWNDSIVHRYVFTVYATDLKKCPVEGEFTADEVLAAIEGHVLDKASITGLYRLNPDVDLP